METPVGGEPQKLDSDGGRDISAELDLSHEHVDASRRIKFDIASAFEIFLVLCFIYYFMYRYGPDINRISGSVGGIFISALLNTQFVPWLMLLLFFEVFSYILLRKTIFVGAVLTILSRFKVNEANGDTHAAIRDVSSIAVFQDYIERSKINVESARRRPNALLFVGTVIAVSGLIFFVYTLPDFGSSVRVVKGTLNSPSKLIGDGAANYEETIEHKLSASEIFAQVIPRLSMLVFIQILAGFFLRQYRSSMEEFRYYEAILRTREEQYLSFILRKEIQDIQATKEFAAYLLNVRDFGHLDKGKSTQVLEAQRYEVNEFVPIIQKLVSLLPIKQEQEKMRGD